MDKPSVPKAERRASNGGFAGTLEVNADVAYEYYKLEVRNDNYEIQMSDMKFVYEDNQTLSVDDAPFHAYFPATLYN